MTIDVDTLLKVLQLVITIGVGLYAWIMSQGKAADHEIKSIRDEKAALEARVAKLEGEMEHLPDKDTVHRIELAMGELKARSEAQADVVKAVKLTIERVENFLLDQRKEPATTQTIVMPATPAARRRSK